MTPLRANERRARFLAGVAMADFVCAVGAAVYGLRHYDLVADLWGHAVGVGQWSIIGATVLALHGLIVLIIAMTYPEG